MSDDQGWGDVGFRGHPHLKTPHLDRLAEDGIRLERFYAAAPVCSPTRGSQLSGRHPARYGIPYANQGHLPIQEISLAEAFSNSGYATGHFGKWHLGTLSNQVRDGRRGGRQPEHFSPPWHHGFQSCFSTEQAVPTWNPIQNQKIPTHYWLGPGVIAQRDLSGDDSRVIVDRALPFMQEAIQKRRPFFAVLWFHAPHSPVLAGPEHRLPYADLEEDYQHYYGCISAMDQQIGRLRQALQEWGAAENTLIWFCSDNGPAASGGGPGQKPGGRQRGSTAGLRGRKGSLYEGGIRVPAMVVWPQGLPKGKRFSAPVTTSDVLPTVLAAAGIPYPDRQRPLDGENILPWLQKEDTPPPRGLAFLSKGQLAFMQGRFKMVRPAATAPLELYDLERDPSERQNLAEHEAKRLAEMEAAWKAWRQSCRRSRQGADYSEP
ncbi:MAG: N-acetylgalactosamine-6-sulfatase [Planctomycetota bacterium]|nr:MAG: N-acetylgalactosamine-6-sulfatase [Planctomycetota bacterium]